MAEPAHGNLDDRKSVQGPSARAQPQLSASVVGTTSLGGRPRAGSVCPRTARPSDASAWRSPSAFPAAAWPARAPANRTSSGSVNSSTGGSPGSGKPLRLIPPYSALHRPRSSGTICLPLWRLFIRKSFLPASRAKRFSHLYRISFWGGDQLEPLPEN
jgi:hypothetical protein